MPDLRLLTPPDSRHFIAAVEWLHQSQPERAQAQLDQIRPEFQSHPDVLELRWNCQMLAQAAEAAVATGFLLVQVAPERPESWLACAQALHTLRHTQEAWENLLPAAARFPRQPLVFYNLACYACGLGQLEAARQMLLHALDVGDRGQLKAMALAEQDLQALWPAIRKMKERNER